MRQVAIRLAEHGHQVTVATSRLPEREADKIDEVEIAAFDVRGNLVRGISGEADAYRRFVLQGNYDVFLVKAAQQWTFDALIPVLDRMTKPKIFVPCGFSGLYDPAYAEYYRRMPEWLAKFDQLVFYASDYRDINLARAHAPTNFTVIPNGASEREFLVERDAAFRRRHGIAEDAFVVLTVGSLTGLKGHRELAQAFALARFPDNRPAVLLLNGNDPFRKAGLRGFLGREVKPLLLRAGLEGPLKALGFSTEPRLKDLVAKINESMPATRALLTHLPRSELIQAYLNSDLFVFASNVEYSPLVLYEAAAAGLPFLSVPVGNAEEIARLTGGGEICPAPRDARGYTRPDPATLARHMESLAVREQDRRAYGEAGRRNWREQFTWQRIALRYEDVFVRLLEEKARHVATDTRPVAGHQA
jgi:glycosyltransferase involved in cell wall biosynthesis